MITIYIAFDSFEYGEDFTLHRICKRREDALRYCLEEDLRNAIKLNHAKDFYIFRLQKVCVTKKEYATLKKQAMGLQCGHRERLQVFTMLEKFYNGECHETEVLLSINERDAYFKAIEFYIGANPRIEDFSSFEEFDFAETEYSERFRDIMSNDCLLSKALDAYIKKNMHFT